MQSNPPISNGRPASLSFDTPFPLVQKSSHMRNFIENMIEPATAILSSRHQRVFPLILGANWLEMPSFLLTIAKALNIPADGIHVDMSRNPMHTDAILDKKNAFLVIASGDRVSRSIQTAFLALELAHTKMFIAVVRNDPKKLVEQKAWYPRFNQCATVPFKWPSWSQRAEDHEELLIEMSQRLRLDLSIDAAAAELLKPGAPVEGTDDACALLKRRAGTIGRQPPQERESLVSKPDTLFPPTP